MRFTLPILLCSFLGASLAIADPEADREGMREFYAKRFPDVALADHKDGVYAIDAGAREQWLEMEEFPPYEIGVDEGLVLFETPFASGSGYAECFGDGAVKQNYPYFDETSQSVVTLELAINQCRQDNGEPALDFASAEMVNLMAYMAFQSRGHPVAVPTPSSEGALAAFDAGKRFYTTRRGQLNFSCSGCHIQIVGNMLRAEKLSASLGHVTHWPVYRFKWEALGGLHLRFQECNSQVRAEPFELQSDAYRNLEYFLSYMANGLELNGPATRK
jgi:sulfur-oxidizing protein SoxA